MDYLPLFMDVRDRPCLLVGAGSVGVRKAAQLGASGAALRVVAPAAEPELQALAESGSLTWHPRGFEPGDLDGCVLVVAATADRALNAQVARLAAERAIPVNVVDDPELCTVIMPAVVDRSPVVVAISTGASAPTLARLLRGRVETAIPERYGDLARLARELRDDVKARVPSGRRRAFWESVLQGAVAEMVLKGDLPAARSRALADLEGFASAEPASELHLIHGGTGRLDDITLGALRRLERADLVIHDPGLPEAIGNLCRRDGQREAVSRETQMSHAIAALGARPSGLQVCVLRVAAGFDPQELVALGGVEVTLVRGLG